MKKGIIISIMDRNKGTMIRVKKIGIITVQNVIASSHTVVQNVMSIVIQSAMSVHTVATTLISIISVLTVFTNGMNKQKPLFMSGFYLAIQEGREDVTKVASLQLYLPLKSWKYLMSI